MSKRLWLALLALLLVGCYPKVKVYGPVSDPCTLQPQAPPVTQARGVQNPDSGCQRGCMVSLGSDVAKGGFGVRNSR